MRLIDLCCVTLTGLTICTLNVRGEEDTQNVEKRVESILSQMTLQEKLDYIGGTGFYDIKPIPRLGLPQIFMVNGPLGIAHRPFEPTTRYPAGLALAASWNRDRAAGRGKQLGLDARARGCYVNLGPGINIYRTPLGGRNFEYSAGEDPYLAGQLVVPLVDAMQRQGVWANVKHYVCNDQEYRREKINIEVDERALREIYLPPFEAAVKEANAASVMGAFNAVNGKFCCQNRFLDTEVLKREWGFTGVLLSDFQAIKNGLEAAKAGMDVDMPKGIFMNSKTLRPSIRSGQLPTSSIDDKVRRILRKIVTFKFLDRPQLDTSIPLDDPASKLECLNEAREGIVLLKNRGNILPLDRNNVRSIAVLGLAAQGTPPTGFGSSFVKAIDYVSELQGIQSKGSPTVRVDFVDAGTANAATAVWESLGSDDHLQSGLNAEYFNSNDLSGSPAVRRVDRWVNFDWTQSGSIPVSEQKHFSARWTGRVFPKYTGDHVFKVRADGGVRLYVESNLVINTFRRPTRPPVYGTTIPHCAKMYLEAGRGYDVRLEYRRTSGFTGDSGALEGVQFSWAPLVPPPDISSYDAVVMCQGLDSDYEGEGLDRAFTFEDDGFAGLDRAFKLPEFQDELIENVVSRNPRTIVVLHGGGSFDIQGWVDQVPALLHAWYPGENGGLALGEILFGDVNPSAKLPITMEKRLQDNPTSANYPTSSNATTIYYAEGIFVGYRGYEKNHTEPQFPFGYGLSYTTFTYSDLKIQARSFGGNQLKTVTFTVTNSGKRAGAEVAELYVGKQTPQIIRPIKELKGFQKVFLDPGESKQVTLELDQRSVAFFNTDKHQWDTEPGVYNVLVGASSRDIRLSGQFALDE
jgi:beta-glucosidase